MIAYVAILVSVASWWVIFKTRFGLRLRSVGEHPQAADTLGINVYRMRYYGVMISGFLGGVGGAVYAQSISNNFAVTTIAGPGFIALAAMIFGRWSPIQAMLSSLFFGYHNHWRSLENSSLISHVQMSIYRHHMSDNYVLAFFVSVAPKADGVN